MKKSRWRMYAPFLAVVLAQSVLIAAYPSQGTDRSVAAGQGFTNAFPQPADGSTPGGVPAPTQAADGTDPAGTLATGSSGSGAGTGTVAGGTGASSGASGASGGGAQTTTPAGAPAEGNSADTSHCVGGRQFQVYLQPEFNPICKPKWPAGADNGGATWNGVTGDTVKIVVFEATAGEAAEAVLSSQGLSSTAEQRQQVNDVANQFVNRFYETYGRTVEFIRYESDCPATSQDVPTCIAEARRIIEMQPFAVIFGIGSYPEVFDEFTRAGIVSLGGIHFSENFFVPQRPYRWDAWIGGTESADFMAEYFCKKLAGKQATNSGATIHPLIGRRGQVTRKLGVVVPEYITLLPDGQRVRDAARACGSEVELYTYSQNTDQSQVEANGIASAMVNDRITTVLCMCGPLFPAFLTTAFSSNTFFPEHLMAGTNFTDADKVGRLYGSDQWRHAFGPSQVGDTRTREDQQVGRAFAAVDHPESPCDGCPVPWLYYSLAASMIHHAGPDLNPGSLEAGMFGIPRFGGNGVNLGYGFGTGDYTWIDDVREVYWDPNHPSPVDGRSGAYRSLNGGRRYALGAFDGSFDVPVGS